MAILNRNRLFFSLAMCLVIISGLLSRAYAHLFPEWINIYLGDALYALMIYLGFSALFIHQSFTRVGWISLVFCYSVELSQLYHAPWIDTIRSTRLGGLILGYGFLWSDIIAYTIGSVAGIIIRRLLFDRFFLDQIGVTVKS